MISRIHTKLGTAGLIVAIVALVAALTGAAFAAGGLTKQQEKQVKKIAKKYAGKPGPAGPQGPVGPQGAKGDPGAKGETGSEGKQGLRGEAGEAGEAGMCSEENPECTLGEGAELTGVWAASGGEDDAALAAISFPVRVSPAPKALYPAEFEFLPGVVFGQEIKNGAVSIYGPHPSPGTPEELEEDEDAYKAACPGSFSAPSAGSSGFLCIYPGPSTGELDTPITFPASNETANEFGIVLPFRTKADFSAQRGSWAVAG
jgi:hypothetical protein